MGAPRDVLDWGGADKAPDLVLLTGLGDNAHVYDQFAFQFTDDFHVIGITRRGFCPPASRNGYDVETRARDDIAVLDAFGIDKATFVGHSIAGSELSSSARCTTTRGASWSIWMPPTWRSASPRAASRLDPLFTDADLKSLWAYQAASARLLALRNRTQQVCLG